MQSMADCYREVSEQATLAEAGGLAKERSVLLLWFLRNVVGIGELEAYDHVCDGDKDKGIDGLFVEKGSGDASPDTLTIFQSKYTKTPYAKVGPTDIDRLAGAANHFVNASTLEALMDSGAGSALIELIDLLNIKREVSDPATDFHVRLVMVTTGVLNGDAQRQVAALREKHGEHYIDVWDINRLGAIANAVKSPDRLQASVHLNVDTDVLITGASPNRVAILPVRASELVIWDGIENRQLFALNFRHELRSNRVSKALDSAIEREADHRDFLSYHNGITVICDEFIRRGGQLTITNPSVVNGAQSVLAFRRGSKESRLSDDLRVFVKIVEVKDRPLLEKEVGRRSNTQTGMSSRNLMANHGTQLRLQREFADDYPHISYETRPDILASESDKVIKNDDAAQLLCAIINEWPWLAVKKASLFNSDNHPHIFSEHIHAHHVLFAYRIREAVQSQKDEFPKNYQSSWLLTRIVACYLVGQIVRESRVVPELIRSTAVELEDASLLSRLNDFAFVASVSLGRRSDELGEADQFRRDFKNEQKLKSLGASAREAYRLWAELQSR